MNQRQKVMDIIANAQATEQYHRFPPFEITDGVLALAEVAGCFWFLSVIASYQHDKRLCKEFQVWKLEVDLETQSAVVRGCNDDEDIIVQEVEQTDFPLESLKLFLIRGVLLLPREY